MFAFARWLPLAACALLGGCARAAPSVAAPAAAAAPARAAEAALPALPVAAAPEDLTTPEIAERAGASVVVVQTGGGFGTGFVVGDDLVATNLHVIAGRSDIEVRTAAGARLTPRGVAAISSAWDLALLYVPRLGLPALRLGDSERVRVGEPVVAIGHPQGLSLTVSTGIVSQKRGESATDLLQTTAPISPGSSGGPLLDGRGAVVGVVTLFFREGQALNFAVASARLVELIASMDGRYATLERFASTTTASEGLATERATPGRSAPARKFPAAVAGFTFGLRLAEVQELCPQLMVHTATVATCPYLRVELDFASAPAQLVFADGRLVGIGLSPERPAAVLEALSAKYGEPVPLVYRGEEWHRAERWAPGTRGAVQWTTDEGFVRYGSSDGQSSFLVFISDARRAIQESNY